MNTTTVRILHYVEACTWDPTSAGLLTHDATVNEIKSKLRLTETTTRRHLRKLIDGGFVRRIPATFSGDRFAHRALRKDEA